jgi:hypothetical protein
MLELSAHVFYQSTTFLNNLRNTIRSWEKQKESYQKATDIINTEDAKFIADGIDELIPQLRTLGARLTQMSCLRLQERLLELPLSIKFRQIATSVESISQRLTDELTMTTVLVIEADKQKYYDPPAPLFGIDVANNFLSVSFELDESAKCLALGRPTACVFHLMRVMEIGIRATARCLQIPDPIKPAERNWGRMIKKIWDGIEAKWPNPSNRATGDGEFFEALYASLDAVKNPWRNATMHVEKKYTDDEAEHIFVAVKGFMKALASRCDENGDPNA